MYFSMKNYLKSICNYTTKHALHVKDSVVKAFRDCRRGHSFTVVFVLCFGSFFKKKKLCLLKIN